MGYPASLTAFCVPGFAVVWGGDGQINNSVFVLDEPVDATHRRIVEIRIRASTIMVGVSPDDGCLRWPVAAGIFRWSVLPDIVVDHSFDWWNFLDGLTLPLAPDPPGGHSYSMADARIRVSGYPTPSHLVGFSVAYSTEVFFVLDGGGGILLPHCSCGVYRHPFTNRWVVNSTA